MDLQTLQSALAQSGIPEVRYFNVIGSTNDEAMRWVQSGAAEGSLVVADSQTQGRGRLGRAWITQPGAALAFSIILKPRPEEISRFGLFSPLAALAVCHALESLFGFSAEIKWPNDVLLQGRKVCGILAEASWSGSVLEGVVSGIGINVSRLSVPPDAQVLFPAISVEHALGRPVDRVRLLRAVVQSLLEWRAQLGSSAFYEAWNARLAFKNQMVRISHDAEKGGQSGSISGRVIGVDASGSLLLQVASGEERAVTVGDLHLRPAHNEWSHPYRNYPTGEDNDA